MGGYFARGSNWLQLRPPEIRCSLLVASRSQEEFRKHNKGGTRSRVERIRGMRSERSEWQRDRPASEDSCCAMNKERVGCNGCEAVSTLSDSDRGEGVPVPTS